MKKTLVVACFIVGYSITAMSCAKEYTCACVGYNEIVEANSTTEAERNCEAKGPNCELQ